MVCLTVVKVCWIDGLERVSSGVGDCNLANALCMSLCLRNVIVHVVIILNVVHRPVI